MNKLPISYKEKDADRCSKCKHVFRYMDYEQPDEFYCKMNQPKRPICGSVYMNESFVTNAEKGLSYDTNSELIYKKITQLRKKWIGWSKGLEVSGELGRCDNFERVEDERIK